mmetsp:Transcript_21807/g.40133  ORF Transcript_21807/g.40133 Transcript_21807/m.40133 type:complete len:316 (-) Transcript_21807:99-1046(-)
MVLIAWQAMSNSAGMDGEADQPQVSDSAQRRPQLEIVVGQPMHDTTMVKFFRRVIVLATAIATWSVCEVIITLLRGQRSFRENGEIVWTLLTSLALQLSIPACGYFGAVHTNLPLTCCFSGCNLFLAILTIIGFIRGHINVARLDGDCSQEPDDEKRKNCELLAADGLDLYWNHGRILLALCLDCLGFGFGAALYQRLTQESGTRSPPLVVGDPLLVAPQGIGVTGRGGITFTRGQDARVHASSNDGSGTAPLDAELATWVSRAMIMAQSTEQGGHSTEAGHPQPEVQPGQGPAPSLRPPQWLTATDAHSRSPVA